MKEEFLFHFFWGALNKKNISKFSFQFFFFGTQEERYKRIFLFEFFFSALWKKEKIWMDFVFKKKNFFSGTRKGERKRNFFFFLGTLLRNALGYAFTLFFLGNLGHLERFGECVLMNEDMCMMHDKEHEMGMRVVSRREKTNALLEFNL